MELGILMIFFIVSLVITVQEMCRKMGLHTPTKNSRKVLSQRTENIETSTVCWVTGICVISDRHCRVNEQCTLCEVLTIIHCNDLSLALIRGAAMQNLCKLC